MGAPLLHIKKSTSALAGPESGFAKADIDFIIWSNGAPILN